MTNQITTKLKTFLEEELEKLLKEYNEFREGNDHEGGDVFEAVDATKAENLYDARIHNLKCLIKGKSPVNPVVQKEVIALGSQVVIEIGGRTETIVLDGVAYKLDGVKLVSVDSPVGKKLLGKRVGEVAGKVKVKEILPPW